MITPATIQTVIETARIEEVVSDFITLKKRGANYLGLCPFHNEKTPSFTVSPAKGIFKCFGCSKGGNSINFVMEHEHYSYPEAIRFLARKYNIEIDEEVQTAESIEMASEKESLFNVLTFAQKHYSHVLLETEVGKAIGLAYFKERGFREDVIQKFQLGFSPNNSNELIENAFQNGYQKDVILKAGLAIEKNNMLSDRFHDRVIFPIHNITGRVVGFGGRILTSDKTKAKYINSPETEVYNKSKILYGLYFAKNSIISENNCYLVEGYTDVISFHQSGIENVVASSGTSLTIEQIKLIHRYTPNITILYDADAAGIKASFRGIDLILEEGMNVNVVSFPEGEDPDSFARNNRPAVVKEFIHKNATNFILFKTSLLLKETQGDPTKKASLIKDIVNDISLIPDGISRNLFIRECSQLFDMSEQTLMNELNRLLRKKFVKAADIKDDVLPEGEYPIENQTIENVNSIDFQEKELIRILLNYGSHQIIAHRLDEKDLPEEYQVSISEFIIYDLRDDGLTFENPLYASILNEFASCIEQNFFPDNNYFTSHPDEEIARLAVDMMSTPYQISENWMKFGIHVPLENETEILTSLATRVLFSFKTRKVEALLSEKQNMLKEVSLDDNDLQLILFEIKQLQTIRNQLSFELQRTISK
ncbi:MAG: DNA primase [Bacteroidota bacterium]